MASRAELTQRIRELRRRHFGPRGKAEFARRLQLPLEDYEAYERNQVPPGEVLLRMCEATGEDLQWLLTGVAARGTLVISNAPHRHQQLLTRIAQRLEQQPELASPIEAFFDLLTRAGDLGKDAALRLPQPDNRDLIPVLRIDELPERLPDIPPPSGGRMALRRMDEITQRSSTPARLMEPHGDNAAKPADTPTDRPADTLARSPATHLIEAGEGTATRRYVQAPSVLQCFPNAFAIDSPDDFADRAGNHVAQEVLIVAPDLPAAVGRSAVCHLRGRRLLCGTWLGADERTAVIGDDHSGDAGVPRRIPADDVHWALELLFRVAANN